METRLDLSRNRKLLPSRVFSNVLVIGAAVTKNKQLIPIFLREATTQDNTIVSLPSKFQNNCWRSTFLQNCRYIKTLCCYFTLVQVQFQVLNLVTMLCLISGWVSAQKLLSTSGDVPLFHLNTRFFCRHKHNCTNPNSPSKTSGLCCHNRLEIFTCFTLYKRWHAAANRRHWLATTISQMKVRVYSSIASLMETWSYRFVLAGTLNRSLSRQPRWHGIEDKRRFPFCLVLRRLSSEPTCSLAAPWLWMEQDLK